MGKMLTGVAIGFFVGAVVVEVVRRTKPKALSKVGEKIKQGAGAAKDAFMDGYRGQTQSA